MGATRLSDYPIHLGRGASAEIEPRFSGEMDWFAGYGDRHASDGAEGRLVSSYTFDSPWDAWEMHPKGAEVVICTEGTLTLHQEKADGTRNTVTLNPGEYAINEPGTWHTADVAGRASAVFITAGEGTRHRPR